jgi:hypothetical protein
MSEQDQTLIDPALHAEDEAYRPSLGGIYPSQGQGRAGNNNSSVGLEDEGYGPRSHPHPGRAGDGPAVKKKRTSSAAAGDEEGRKKSRQSRESILTRFLCQY